MPELDHSIITKMPFWMIQRAKSEVFGHFLEFGVMYGPDIAYEDCSKYFSVLGDDKRSCIISEVCLISIYYAKKS